MYLQKKPVCIPSWMASEKQEEPQAYQASLHLTTFLQPTL